MEIENNDIGAAFREKFENFEATPSPMLWEGLKKEKFKHSPKARTITLVGLATAVVAVAVYFAVIYTPEPLPTTPNKTVIESKPIANDKTKLFNILPDNFGTLLLPLNSEFLTKPTEPNISETASTTITDSIRYKLKKKDTTSNTFVPNTKPEVLQSSVEVATTAQETAAAPIRNTPVLPKEEDEPVVVKETLVELPKPVPAKEPEMPKYEIFIPSAFTPDGVANQVFKAVASDVVAFEMRIFDSKGKQIFFSKDINQGWTGNGAISGAYVYAVKCTNSLGQIFQKKGSVNLIRNY